MRQTRIYLAALILIMLFAFPGIALAATLQVTWNANSESDLAGYRVSFGTAPGSYTSTVNVGNVTSYNVTNAAAGNTYYVAVKAYNTSALESAYSDEVSATVPAVDTTAPTGSISINAGAASASSRVVTLRLSATDAGGTVAGMQLSADGTTWGAVSAYATSQAWTLTSGDGVKTVYVRYIDNSGNVSAAFSDSITLAQDSDGDGLTDAYESAHGLNSSNASDAGLDSDGDGYTNYEEYVSGTDPQNKYDNAPTVSAGSNQRSNPTRIYLSGTATDPNSAALSYAWSQVSGPATVTLNNATSTAANFLGVKSGTYRFMFTAANSRSSSSSTVDVTINNMAPALSLGNNVTIDAGQSVTLRATGSDANGDSLSYAWSLSSGPAISLPALNTQSITINPVTAGNYIFSAVCSDGSLSSAAATVTVTVNKLNNAPTANAGSDQTAQYGATVALDGSASADPDSDALSYAWSQVSGPAATLSSTSAAKPGFTANATGTLVFQLIVSDGQVSSTADSVSITVVRLNNAPIAEAGDNLTVNAGTTVTLDGSGSYDPDGDNVSYAWSQTSGATVSLSGSTTASPRFTPTVAGTLQFTLRVSDGQASAQATVQVTVNSVNHVPVAEAGTGFAATVGSTVSLDGRASYDPDGTAISYAWSQVSGTKVSLSNPNSSRPSFVPSAAGTYTFSLQVSDGQATSTADTVTISVQNGVVSIQPLSPSNGVTISTTPTFSWGAPGLTSFSLYFKQNSGKYMKLYSGSATSYTMSAAVWKIFVAPGTTISWYVVGANSNGGSATSAVFTFVRK